MFGTSSVGSSNNSSPISFSSLTIGGISCKNRRISRNWFNGWSKSFLVIVFCCCSVIFCYDFSDHFSKLDGKIGRETGQLLTVSSSEMATLPSNYSFLKLVRLVSFQFVSKSVFLYLPAGAWPGSSYKTAGRHKSRPKPAKVSFLFSCIFYTSDLASSE